MVVTDMIHKIFHDYENSDLTVNSSVKYRFMYNGYQTDIFYTKANGLQNQLLIAITIKGIDYLSTLNFSQEKNGEFYMNYYLPPELYKNVQFTLLYVGGKCRTTPYFEQMARTILNDAPIPANHINDIFHRNLHQYKEPEDNPYFETIIRKSMSPTMIKKINQKYDSNLAQQIFKYCGQTMTLRFTSDIAKSRDILTFLQQPT